MSPPQTAPEASRLVRALACATGIAVLAGSAGCGSSARHPNPQPAAERYVTGRIDRELRHVGPLLRRAAGTQPDVFVYCRAAGGNTLLCRGTVTSSVTHEPIAGQRWRVQSDGAGRVVSAQALDVKLVPAGSVAQRLAADRAARRAAALHLPRPRRLATLSLTPLKIALPPTRTYACVADGSGKVLFQGVITAPKRVRVRAPRLRLNLGNSNLTVRVNGRVFRIPASPYGLAIAPGHVSYLPKGRRPCNR